MRRGGLLLALGLALWGGAGAAGAIGAYDLVLAGARVIDPESGLDGLRWVAVLDGRIHAISEQPLEGVRVVNLDGLVLAPGFVDLHAHGQEPGSYDLMAQDGVTAALDLEAGVHDLSGFLARREERARVHYGASAGHLPARARAVDGIRLEHFLTAETMERGPRLWWTFLRHGVFASPDYAHAPSTPGLTATVVALLERELDAGAIGIGLGLAYAPGASPEEVRAVFTLAARRGVPCFVHLRSQAHPRDLAPIESALGHARATGAALHVVHVNSSGLDVAEDFLARIDAARAEGLDVSVEAYPYAAASTRIESAYFDPGWRERLGADYGDLVWTETGERLDAERFAALRDEGGTVVAHVMDPERVARVIAHPGVMIASDGMPMIGAAPHPRGAGSHARVLGHHVRERGDFDWPTALRKLALDPARRLEAVAPALARKGRIRVGADADLVAFDPETVGDRASYEHPKRPSAGIRHVWVAGHAVVRNGELVPDAAPGRPLRAVPEPAPQR